MMSDLILFWREDRSVKAEFSIETVSFFVFNLLCIRERELGIYLLLVMLRGTIRSFVKGGNFLCFC